MLKLVNKWEQKELQYSKEEDDRRAEEQVGKRKKQGHAEGQNSLEPITQCTQWDPSTQPHSPTYSSHDVILQQATALFYITAHSSGETASDKPD